MYIYICIYIYIYIYDIMRAWPSSVWTEILLSRQSEFSFSHYFTPEYHQLVINKATVMQLGER